MSKRPRTHYARESQGDQVFAECHALTTRWTRERDDVTCKRCLRELVAFDALPFTPVSVPWVPPPPRAAVMGTRHLTPHAERAIAESKSGKRQRFAFHNLDDALKRYAAVKVDGYSSASASGGTEQLGIMGCMIQTGGGGSSKTTRLAEDIAQISACIQHALSSWHEAHPDSELTTLQVEDLWLLMEVGKPMKERAKRKAGKRDFVPKEGQRAWTPMKPEEVAEESGLHVAVVRKLRRWCTRGVGVELMARKLMGRPPEPVTKEEPTRAARRLKAWRAEDEAVEKRMKELGK